MNKFKDFVERRANTRVRLVGSDIEGRLVGYSDIGHYIIMIDRRTVRNSLIGHLYHPLNKSTLVVPRHKVKGRYFINAYYEDFVFI